MKNIFLLMKESFVDLKGKSFLYTTFSLFIIISFSIIIGLVNFTFSFSNEGNKYVKQGHYPSAYITPMDFEVDDINKDGDFYKYSKEILKKFKYDSDIRDVNNFILSLGNNRGIVDKEKYTRIYDDSMSYYFNFIFKWLGEEKYKNHLIVDDKNKNLNTYFQLQLHKFEGSFDEKEIRISSFKNDDKSLPNWLIHSYDQNDIIWDQKPKNIELLNSKNIVVTPTFLKSNKLKIGDVITIKSNGVIYNNLKIIGTGLQQNDLISDVSDVIYLNPYLYLDRIKNSNPNETAKSTFNFLTPNFFTNKGSEYDDMTKQIRLNVTKDLMNDFSPDLLNIMIDSHPFKNTPYSGYQLQIFLYNMLSWSICILLILLISFVSYFIQKYNISKNKQKLIFLKSLGISENTISFYTIFSIIPLLLISMLLGLGLSIIVYKIFAVSMGFSVGFLLDPLPTSYVGYLTFVLLMLLILTIIYLISYFNLNSNKLSIVNQNKMTRFESSLMKIKNNIIIKKFNIGIDISFIVANLIKAFLVFIITTLTLSVVSLSFQFLSSIKSSATNFNPIFENDINGSLSYQNLNDDQKNISNEITDKNYKEYLYELPNFNFEAKDLNRELLIWMRTILIDPNYSNPKNVYFNQTHDFLNFVNNNSNKIKELNPNIQNKIYKLTSYLELYKTSFGNESAFPVITFYNQPSPTNLIKKIPVAKVDFGYTKLRAYLVDDKNLKINEIEINSKLAGDYRLEEGDKALIDNKEYIVSKIRYDLFDSSEIIMNKKAIKKTGEALLTKDKIPYDLKFITIPKMHGSGNSYTDYINLSKPYNNFNVEFLSFPMLSKAINEKIEPFKELMKYVSIFLVILSLIIILIISLIITLNNDKNMLILKTIGYKQFYILNKITSIYVFFILIGFIASIFIASKILGVLSPVIILKLNILVSPEYNFYTIGISALLAILIYLIISLSILFSYKTKNIKDILSIE